MRRNYPAIAGRGANARPTTLMRAPLTSSRWSAARPWNVGRSIRITMAARSPDARLKGGICRVLRSKVVSQWRGMAAWAVDNLIVGRAATGLQMGGLEAASAGRLTNACLEKLSYSGRRCGSEVPETSPMNEAQTPPAMRGNLWSTAARRLLLRG